MRHLDGVGSPITKSGTFWPTLGPVLLGISLSVVALFWMPWEVVHPTDPNLRRAIGYAPLWSHRFANVTGARPDWPSAFINLAIIWIICGAAAIMFRMSASD